MLVGMERKGSRGYWWWECKLVEPLWKTVARLLRRLKIQMYMIQLSHYCVVIKRKWSQADKKYIFILVIIHKSQNMKSAYMPTNMWEGEENKVATQWDKKKMKSCGL